jgi:hypothetical protein
MSEQVKKYTLDQRRLREQLHKARSLDDVKAFLDKAVIGEPVVVSDFRQRTLDQRRDELKARAVDTYHQTLTDGFTDANGVRWAATADAREKTMALTLRIEAGKGLPNGKTTVRLLDAENKPHDVDAAGVKVLAEKGSDFKDAAEDRLMQLYGQIDAATTHDELDAIDPTSGWLE